MGSPEGWDEALLGEDSCDVAERLSEDIVRTQQRPPDAGAIECTHDGIEPSGPRPLTGRGFVAGIRASS